MTKNDSAEIVTNSLTAPVSMTLFADREVCAVVGLVVAAVIGNEHPANVVTRWTTHLQSFVGIALASVGVTWAVEGVVVATAHTGGYSSGPWRH